MNKKLIIPILSILVVAIAALVYLNLHQRHEMTELVEQMEFEKEQLEEEYEDLAIQFDGYQNLDIRNDSLQSLLTKEQQRVQDLLEELRITKVTNARRIAELKKELATVRAVMVTYVHQIDSLNATNERLTAENKQVREQYTEVTRQNEQLNQEKTHLTEVVTRASMLELIDWQMTTLNKRDRKTRIVSQIQKLQFDYTIGKNITCDPGMKTIYLQVRNPQGEVLTHNASTTFDYEGTSQPYSASQEFEYTGEVFSGVMYWSFADSSNPDLVTEPETGIYNADFFVDGNLIGSYPFEIKH